MYKECKICIVSACCEIKNNIGWCDIRRFKRDLETLDKSVNENAEPFFTKEGGYNILLKTTKNDEFNKTYKMFLRNNKTYIRDQQK